MPTRKQSSRKRSSRRAKSVLPSLRFTKRTGVIFVLIIAIVGALLVWQSRAADVTLWMADRANNLTSDSNGPRSTLDPVYNKRNNQVVYVQAPSGSTNSVYMTYPINAGKYDVCGIGRANVAGSTARLDLYNQLAVAQEEQQPPIGTKTYPANGTKYVSICVPVTFNASGTLYVFDVVTSGSWYFSLVNITKTGNVTPPPTSPPPQPPADDAQDSSGGRFRISCKFSHRAQVDPIVAPNKTSSHMHDFFGNTETSSDPNYTRMINATLRRTDDQDHPGTTCGFSGDKAAYWFPSLKKPDGTFVTPVEFRFYYRARPVEYQYGTNVFPPDFKMIAGGKNAPDTAAYWTCEGESDTGYDDRKTTIPNCTGVEDERLIAHVFFPSCWDGVSLDSADHRSHVAYGLEDGEPNSTNPETCPKSHPYKIPQLDLRVVYPIKDGRGHVLSDGEQLPHADFWNTWQQDALVKLVNDCLKTGENCEGISD